MPETYFIRKAVIQLDTAEPEYRWQDDAACAFQPHTLFEIASFDDRIAEGIVPLGDDPSNELTKLNAANFERAKEICNTCPVWHLCYLEAEESDFEQTVRAGITPTKFNPAMGGRAPLEAEPVQHKPCKNCGSPKEGVKKDGGTFCKPCKYANTARRARERRAEQGRTRKAAKTQSRGRRCHVGHDEWTLKSSSNPKSGWKCRPCSIEMDARRRAKMNS